MLRILGVAATLALMTPNVALAQATDGHVWAVHELRAHPGEEEAYTRALQEFDIPITEEVIRRGGAVSQTLLIKHAGKMADGTHLLIIEYASWDDYIDATEASEEASQSLFGRPHAEVAAAEFVSKRDVIRRDVYLGPPSNM